MEISAGDLAELKKGILFRNMSEEDIRVLMDIMKPERRIYEKNTVVVRDGDFITEMFILISGELQTDDRTAEPYLQGFLQTYKRF